MRKVLHLLPVLLLIGASKGNSADENPHGEAGFQTSDRCMACHNGLTDAKGEDISIGIDWRSSMMANSSRDPYWQASVRREVLDHAESQAAIEDECSVCHMPMAHHHSKIEGRLGEVFSHLPPRTDNQRNREAADGVSCSLCHQISADKLGAAASFNGGFVINGPNAEGMRAEYGPFDVDTGLSRVMHSSTEGFEPARSDHIRSSELCATCHTLITTALGPNGEEIGSLPEQVPYQEWLHSDYRSQRSCQSCHMPAVDETVAVASVLGIKRPGMARHQFIAANFFMQRMFARYHGELRASVPPQEFSAAAERTIHYLQTQAAKLLLSPARLLNGRLEFEIDVENLGGHKLPTAYPSRRAWLHVTVRDRDGRTVFESGALNTDGSIRGNDNDLDSRGYEPHYREIRNSDQVQIFESILEDTRGEVTTGLLSAVGYLKDNRLLPRGFDKATATPDIAVHGDALQDANFTDRGDRVLYSAPVGNVPRPLKIEAELLYQPISYRWANNLKTYEAPEPRRFTEYYDALASGSATVLARATAEMR